MAEVCHTGDMFSGKAWVGLIRIGDFGRRLCYSDGKGLQGNCCSMQRFFLFLAYILHKYISKNFAEQETWNFGDEGLQRIQYIRGHIGR